MKRVWIFFLIFLFAVYLAYQIKSEHDEIRDICSNSSELKISELSVRSSNKNLKFSFSDGTGLIYGSKTFGRVACLIKYDLDVVTSAEFSVVD